VRWQKFSSFGFAKGRLVYRAKPNVLNVRWVEKIKMRVGKNFKNIRVGFECRLVGLCQVVKELSP